MKVTVRFYEELNESLNTDIRKQDLFVEVEKGVSVRELIESMGPPCSVVDLILVNGRPESFEYILQHNDRVSVYPVFERFNIESVTCLDQAPLRNLKFICDVHLGRLAKYLRMLGFDTLYKNDYDDNILIRLSNAYNRILLSRDKALILNKALKRRYLVKQTHPEKQLSEVLDFFDLKNDIAPLSRCLECNGVVRPASKPAVKHRVDPSVFEINNEFAECSGCGKIYWKGSHYGSMMKWISEKVG